MPVLFYLSLFIEAVVGAGLCEAGDGGRGTNKLVTCQLGDTSGPGEEDCMLST